MYVMTSLWCTEGYQIAVDSCDMSSQAGGYGCSMAIDNNTDTFSRTTTAEHQWISTKLSPSDDNQIYGVFSMKLHEANVEGRHREFSFIVFYQLHPHLSNNVVCDK